MGIPERDTKTITPDPRLLPRIRHEVGVDRGSDFDPAVGLRPGDTEQDVTVRQRIRFQRPRFAFVFDFAGQQPASAGGTRTGPTAEGKADSFSLGGIEHGFAAGCANHTLPAIPPVESNAILASTHCHTSLVQSPSGHRISCARAGPFGISPKSTRKSSSSVIVPFRGFTSALSITDPFSFSSG